MYTKIEVRDRLRKFGIKPSLQRIAIMDYLMGHPIHPTADVVFNALHPAVPTLSKTTVYNTLKLFADQGAALSLTIDEKNRRYDADISEHAHFRCKVCGKIADLSVEGFRSVEIKNAGTFTITESQLYYIGYCEGCKNYLGVRS